MIFWSIACASHALASGFWMLAASRFLLGAGEGGGFPAATKTVAEWFPVRERSTAMGLINAGTAVGAVVAPPAIAAIITYGHWRWVFVACGAVGLLWTIWWVRAYFSPAQHPGSRARSAGSRGGARRAGASAGAAPTWSSLLRIREVWGLVGAKFLTDAAWFFYIAWLPKYLYDARGFDVKQVGYYAWVPFAAAGVGSLLGGWFSSRLIASGRSVDFSRKLALGLSAVVMPGIIFVTQVPVEWAIVLFSLAFFGQQSWSTLVMIVPTDLFDRRIVASVAGLVGFGGAMGGLLMNLLAGRLLDLGLRLSDRVLDRRLPPRDGVRRDPRDDPEDSGASSLRSFNTKGTKLTKGTKGTKRTFENHGRRTPHLSDLPCLRALRELRGSIGLARPMTLVMK